MAKSANAVVLDAMGEYIASNCNKITVCTAEPTTYAAATTANNGTTAFMCAEVTVDADDFTQAAYNTTGRQCVVSEQASVPITTAGTATHIAFVKTSTSTLLYVTTAPDNEVLSAGSTLTIPTHNICKVGQPT